jgi:hypothetical protein
MARQTRVVQPVAKATAKKIVPNQQLRLGVFGVDGGHTTMPLFFQKYIHLQQLLRVYMQRYIFLFKSDPLLDIFELKPKIFNTLSIKKSSFILVLKENNRKFAWSIACILYRCPKMLLVSYTMGIIKS